MWLFSSFPCSMTWAEGRAMLKQVLCSVTSPQTWKSCVSSYSSNDCVHYEYMWTRKTLYLTIWRVNSGISHWREIMSQQSRKDFFPPKKLCFHFLTYSDKEYIWPDVMYSKCLCMLLGIVIQQYYWFQCQLTVTLLIEMSSKKYKAGYTQVECWLKLFLTTSHK